jgi:quercetin dioxygenase-like cupin family protein
MKIIDFSKNHSCGDGRYEAAVLFEQGAVKVRRIELAAGAHIPPCRMTEDVVFVVVEGQVTFRTGDEESVVPAPNAVFIPGGATSRSMESDEPSLVLAVLCRRESDLLNGSSRISHRLLL